MRRGALWIAAGALVGIALTVTAVVLTRVRSSSRTIRSSPVLTVIPLPTATLPVALVPTLTPPASPTPSPPPGVPKQFAPGELVQVFGTEGGGLRIRESASLSATILVVGLESEVFEVVDGPIASDGYTWWLLANPFDPSKQGWAADQFLRSVEGLP